MAHHRPLLAVFFNPKSTTTNRCGSISYAVWMVGRCLAALLKGRDFFFKKKQPMRNCMDMFLARPTSTLATFRTTSGSNPCGCGLILFAYSLSITCAVHTLWHRRNERAHSLFGSSSTRDTTRKLVAVHWRHRGDHVGKNGRSMLHDFPPS